MSYEYEDIEVGHQQIELDSNTRLLGTLVHLAGFLGLVTTPFLSPIATLIFWLVIKDNHAFLDDQGKEALNFQISIALYIVISAILCIVIVGIVFLFAALLFWLICPIVAAIKANSGEWYRYPLTIRLVK